MDKTLGCVAVAVDKSSETSPLSPGEPLLLLVGGIMAATVAAVAVVIVVSVSEFLIGGERAGAITLEQEYLRSMNERS